VNILFAEVDLIVPQLHFLILYLLLMVRWAWKTNHLPSVLWHCWLGHRTWKILSLKWP